MLVEQLSPDAVSASDREQIDAIFFAASRTQSFASESERAVFHNRWLGRYLTADDTVGFLLRTANGDVVGYVVGSTDDPARSARFADIAYFNAIADLTPDYSAHLHINLAEAYRGRGLGRRLIQAFACEASARGAQGVHVVTGAASRNITFYRANGFNLLRTFSFNGGLSACLGRPLSAADCAAGCAD